MLKPKKRGRLYRLEGRVAGSRIRFTTGTGNRQVAEIAARNIERALAEGRDSALWGELCRVLPPSAFRKLAALVGYVEKQHGSPSWEGLIRAFTAHMGQLIARNRRRATTLARYEQTFRVFGQFLAERGITFLSQINRPMLEDFRAWRLEKILAKRYSRGGGGLDLDIAILHRVFAHAVEHEMVERNPVKLEGKPGARPERGAQPFTAEELEQLRAFAGKDLPAFLLLRWTGLRGSDAVALRWENIDWQEKAINVLTQKRRKWVWLPLHPELAFALEAERDRRKPQSDDHVLLNPATGKPLTRPRLYARVQALGRRAGVRNAHPHRFRDTFAVDMLLKGASPYDVAKLLGNTIHTVETHYAPFVKELRERARKFMESGQGLEIVGTDRAQSPAALGRVQ